MEDIKAFVKENRHQLTVFSIIVVALIVILLGIMVWKLPVVPVCVVVLLEAGLAVCLQELPIWLHGAVLIAQIIAGLLLGNAIFVLACAVYYMVSVLFLSIFDK